MRTREIDTKKTDFIRLPVSFKNGKAFVVEDNETLLVKKIQAPTISQVREKLRTIKGKISEEEIEREIQAYRRNR